MFGSHTRWGSGHPGVDIAYELRTPHESMGCGLPSDCSLANLSQYQIFADVIVFSEFQGRLRLARGDRSKTIPANRIPRSIRILQMLES